jgi:hypothetical protein
MAAVEPPDGPLSRDRIVRANRDRAIGARRQFQQVVIDVRLPVQQRSHVTCPRKLFPFCASAKAFLETPMADCPVTDEEIEAVHGVQLVLRELAG